MLLRMTLQGLSGEAVMKKVLAFLLPCQVCFDPEALLLLG